MSELERDDLVTAEELIEDAQYEEHPVEEVEEGHVEEHEHVEENEVVSRAKKYGHLSREEWEAQGRDPNQWKSPEEFDKTGKILEQLYSLKKTVEQRDTEIRALVDYQNRTAQREYENAKRDLQTKLQAAKADFDVEAVAHYSREISKVEDMEQHNQIQQYTQQRETALQQFQERNQHWFNQQNPDLLHRAQQIDNELRQIYPMASYDELAQKIEARMSYEYPDRVGYNNSQAKPRPAVSSSVSAVNKTAANVSNHSRVFNGLSQELKDTYNATKRIIEQSGREYPVAEFINRLRKDGEIK